MINIRYGTPNGALSNLTERHFVFDNIQCASLEGFLQGLKYEDVDKQRYSCMLWGHKARQYGQQALDWREKQILFFNGSTYDRHSREYRSLLERAYYTAYSQDETSRFNLLATNSDRLVHSVGHSNPKETILTEREFCSILTELRSQLRAEQFLEF